MFRRRKDQKTRPTLNYLWIGHPPPPKESESSEHTDPGQDVKDVLAMAKAAKNPICFYCLEQYQEYYKSIFADTKVKVQSVEDYLRKMHDEGDNEIKAAVEKIFQIQQTVLTPPRGKVIDFVSFKEVFSLFLLATQGGYTVDSNVHPAPHITKVDLPHYPHFKAPYLSLTPEIWMMYASPDLLDEPRKMLRFYLDGWNEVQTILEKESAREKEESDAEINAGISGEYPLKYHQSIINLSVDAVASVYSPYLGKDNDWRYKYDVGQFHFVARCEGIPIEKTYANSHKIESDYAKSQTNFILQREVKFLENKISKAFGEDGGLNFNLFKKSVIQQAQIIEFLKKEHTPEEILEKLKTLADEAQADFEKEKGKKKICSFKKAADKISAEFKAAFPDRPEKEETQVLNTHLHT